MDPTLAACDLWVAEGTYYAYEATAGDVIDIQSRTLYGGFEGTEDAVDQRDTDLHPTVVDVRPDAFSTLQVDDLVSLGNGAIDGVTLQGIGRSCCAELLVASDSTVRDVVFSGGYVGAVFSGSLVRVEDSLFLESDIGSSGVGSGSTRVEFVDSAMLGGTFNSLATRDLVIQGSTFSRTNVSMSCQSVLSPDQRIERSRLIGGSRFYIEEFCDLTVSDTAVVAEHATIEASHFGFSVGRDNSTLNAQNLTFYDTMLPIRTLSSSVTIENSISWDAVNPISSLPLVPFLLFSDDRGAVGGGNVDVDPEFVGLVASGAWTGVSSSPGQRRSTLTDSGATFSPGALVGTVLRSGSVAADSTCGNFTVDHGEPCDPAMGGGCTDRCQVIRARCGNRMVEPGETCDDGNLIAGDGCTSTCQMESCGNGVKEKWEQCDGADLGGFDCATIAAGTGPGLSCSSECRFDVRGCGGTCEDPAEYCDEPTNCVDCRGESDCGDGIRERGEACDDGNQFADDGCDSCELPSCNADGGGMMGTGMFECTNPGDLNSGCTIECELSTACGARAATCGALCAPVGGWQLPDRGFALLDKCDEIEAASGAGCPAASSAYHTCVGNLSGAGQLTPADACSTEAAAVASMCGVDPGCGNGLLESGESCDEGNDNGARSCEANCTIAASCGDGTLDAAVEDCDDGNNDASDGCSPTCRTENGVPLGLTERWHVVIANDATSLTVAGDMTEYVLVGDAYEVHDLRLQSTSPVIDAADGDSASSTDIDGLPRFDFGSPGGGIGTPNYVDMGAHEFNP
jgi:cysteine-rich repeat protein